MLFLNNSKLSEFIDIIYPCELEIVDTTESNASASYLDCYLCTENGKLVTRFYDKMDDFNFPIVNFPFLISNITPATAYGVYVSQLVRYARCCCKYQDFVDRRKVSINKLFLQGYSKAKLVPTVKQFYGRHHVLIDPYNVAVFKFISDLMASVEA